MRINISPLWSFLGIQDDVSLVQQLFDAYYGEALDSGEIIQLNGWNAENYVRQNPSVCGFRNIQTIEHLILNKGIIPPFKRLFSLF